MTITRWHLAGLCALALAGTAAQAADFEGSYPPRRVYDEGYDHRAPPAPEVVLRRPRFATGPDFGPADECRTFLKRRIDAFGEVVVRRVRVCDEPAGYEDRPHHHHRPAFFEGPPRPPADLSYRGWDGLPRW